MQEIKKVLTLSKLEYYKTHLSLVNCILPVKMTPMEIEVLAAFMSIDTGEDIPTLRFSTPSRQYVKKLVNITSQGLSNYLNTLTQKEFLSKDEDFQILPLLVPEKEQQDYRFRLKFNNNHDKVQERQEVQATTS